MWSLADSKCLQSNSLSLRTARILFSMQVEKVHLLTSSLSEDGSTKHLQFLRFFKTLVWAHRPVVLVISNRVNARAHTDRVDSRGGGGRLFDLHFEDIVSTQVSLAVRTKLWLCVPGEKYILPLILKIIMI